MSDVNCIFNHREDTPNGDPARLSLNRCQRNIEHEKRDFSETASDTIKVN